MKNGLTSFISVAFIGILSLATPGLAADADKPATAVETETGLASFYGESLHGNKTASGEIFNMNEHVAAHPSLPLDSVARVTSLDNQRSVKVRIIDRGPTEKNQDEGVIVDVSQAAAEALDFIKEGRAPVRLDVLSHGK